MSPPSPSGFPCVNARIRTGRLKILAGQCPNLRKESLKYKYPTADGGVPYGKLPIKKDGHVMDASRYAILGIDRKDIAKGKGQGHT